MPKLGYKQSKEHKLHNALAHKRRKPKPKPIEEAPPVFRDYKCLSYFICLKTAALLNHAMECTDCPNRRYKIPKASEYYYEMLAEDAENCYHLLRAVFHQEAWLLEERSRAMAEKQVGVVDVDEPVIEWLV